MTFLRIKENREKTFIGILECHQCKKEYEVEYSNRCIRRIKSSFNRKYCDSCCQKRTKQRSEVIKSENDLKRKEDRETQCYSWDIPMEVKDENKIT